LGGRASVEVEAKTPQEQPGLTMPACAGPTAGPTNAARFWARWLSERCRRALPGAYGFSAHPTEPREPLASPLIGMRRFCAPLDFLAAIWLLLRVVPLAAEISRLGAADVAAGTLANILCDDVNRGSEGPVTLERRARHSKLFP
jgi:hypothetical protein